MPTTSRCTWYVPLRGCQPPGKHAPCPLLRTRQSHRCVHCCTPSTVWSHNAQAVPPAAGVDTGGGKQRNLSITYIDGRSASATDLFSCPMSTVHEEVCLQQCIPAAYAWGVGGVCEPNNHKSASHSAAPEFRTRGLRATTSDLSPALGSHKLLEHWLQRGFGCVQIAARVQ